MKNEYLDFIRSLQELYLEQRDMNNVLSAIDKETSWIGTGRQEICKSFSEAEEALLLEKREYNGGFTIIDSWYETRLIAESICIVYGEFWAMANNQTAGVADLHYRISAVCSKTEEGMKLLHLHMSTPDDDQESGEYYVKTKIKGDNQKLRLQFAQTARELHDRSTELEILTSNIPGGVHRCSNNTELTILSMSRGFLDMFGYTEAEIKSIFDNSFTSMIYEGDRTAVSAVMREQLSRGKTVEFEYRVKCKDGSLMWVLDRGRLVTDSDGTETFFCMMMDITNRKAEDEKLRLALERHKVIMDQATDIIFEWDIASDTIDFSSNWEKRFGYPPIRKDISKKIPLSHNIHPEDMRCFVKIMIDTAAGVPYSETEFRIKNISGEYIWCRIRATAQFDSEDRPIMAVGVIVDISVEKQEKQMLLEQAQKDALTGLYNKATVKALVEQHLTEKGMSEQQALLIIDIDRFKAVNDTYGHLCGDSLLSDISLALKSHFRASDIIGRIGGDEFLVYMPEISGAAAVEAKAREILNAVGEIRPAKDAEPVSCCIGAAVFPQRSVDYFAIYKCADRALYHMKKNGKNGIAFYDPSICSDCIPSGLASSAVSEFIDSEQCSVVEEKLAQYTFQMLYQSIDVKTAVNRLLEIVGRSYGVSRVYIFESSDDGLCCNNTFEWCEAGVTSEIENLQGIRYKEDLGDYFQNFNEDGVFYCRDINTLHPSLYNVLAPQGIRSLLQCAVINNGMFKGYVGFDECKENCIWSKEQIRSLTLIANTLSVFLIKLRLEEQIERYNAKTKEDKEQG